MRKLFLFGMLLSMSVIQISCGDAAKDGGEEQTSGTDSSIVYTCPMHPEVRQNKPGQCPQCNMTLEDATAILQTKKILDDQIKPKMY